MSEKLKIVYRPLQELSPYAHNARTHSTEQVAQLVESIKQFGWTNPVLIDEKGEIIAGHGRVMAAEMLKMDSVPVIVLSGLTDEQKKAYRLADNRLPMNAGWDEDLLRMELSDLINADFDVSLTGFIPTEIDELLTDVLPGSKIFDFNGNISCKTLTQISDQSLKDNIKVIGDATESIRKMNGYTYTFKGERLPYAGIIAQEVMDALPEAIVFTTRYGKELQGPTTDGEVLREEMKCLSVDYAAVTGLLVQVAREIDDRVTALEEENTTLRQNLATADTRISTLENQVSELVALVRQLTGSEH